MIPREVAGAWGARLRRGATPQPNMHFSLSRDMVALDDLLVLLRDHGIQHVATKIAYREI